MTLSKELWEQVRQRANGACEFCGVSESDVGGLLSVDHFQPQSRGGTDELGNLLYCCDRCNQYKADYWPTQTNDLMLWNPRQKEASAHLANLTDGTLLALTPTGKFTLERLRLNRPPLVSYRLRKQTQNEQRNLFERLQETIGLLEQIQRQQAVLLEAHRALLEQQRALLKALLED